MFFFYFFHLDFTPDVNTASSSRKLAENDDNMDLKYGTWSTHVKSSVAKNKGERSSSNSPKNGCDCACCVNGPQIYGKNMSAEGGHQKLYKYELGCLELIRLLNLEQPHFVEALKRSLNYCIAAYDIESFDRKIEQDLILNVKSGLHDPDGNRSSEADVTRHWISQQIPFLLGFTDKLMAAEPESPIIEEQSVSIFQVRNNDLTQSSNVIIQFFDFILERQRFLKKEKEKLCKPLFDIIERYKFRYFNFFASRGYILRNEEWNYHDFDELSSDSSEEYYLEGEEYDEEDQNCYKTEYLTPTLNEKRMRQCKQAFAKTLMGQLEIKLRRICEKLTVYGFNASNYDLPLICPVLVTEILNRDSKASNHLRIQLEGHSVRWLQYKQLTFADVRFLLAPGFSLDSFAKTCNLKVEKSHFPWSQFTSMDFLQQKEFSWDLQDWVNILSNSSKPQISPEIIEVIKAEFRGEQGHPNVESYLKKYLRKDCLILLA